MAKINRLRGVRLNEISFVGKGDNPEANVLLLKMKQEPDASIVHAGKECKGKKQEAALKKWLEENAGLVKKDDGDALTFEDIQNDKMLRDQVWGMCWTLEDSLGSILRDDSVTDKTAMIQQSIDQFKAAITAITKGEKTMDVELKKAQDELKAEQEKTAALEKQVETVTKENEALKASVAGKDEEIAKLKKPEGEDDIYKGLPEGVVKKMKEDSATIAKMQDNELTREYVGKAASVSLVGPTDTVGDLLKSIAKTDPALADKVYEIFKTANERIKEGDLLKESGKDDKGATGTTAHEKILAKAEELRKSRPELTIEKAYTEIFDTDAELRKQYETERNAA